MPVGQGDGGLAGAPMAEPAEERSRLKRASFLRELPKALLSCLHRGRAAGSSTGPQQEVKRENVQLQARGTPPPVGNSLLSLSARAAALGFDGLPPRAVQELPPDLAQLILDELARLGLLTRGRLAAFQRQALHWADLAGCVGVDHDWLRLLGRSPLLRLRAADCLGLSDAGLAALAHQRTLQRLDLQGCRTLTAAGLAHLAGLRSLRELDLRGCSGLQGAGALRGLGALEALDLERCSSLSDFAFLGGLTGLRSLTVGWCSAFSDADLAVASGLTRLTRLGLQRTRVTNVGVVSLGQLRRLATLQLEGTTGIAAEDPAESSLCTLAGLPCLAALELQHCPVGQARKALGQVSRLTGLTALDLAYTTAGNRVLAKLGSAETLRTLCLDNTAVTSGGIHSLTRLSCLEALDLTDTEVDNAAGPALARLTSLRALTLAFCRMDDQGLEPLAALTGLTLLSLDSRRFSGAALRALAPLTRLAHLDLYSARLMDDACAYFRPFQQLTWLEACGGGVTAPGAAALAAALPRLASLSLAQNARLDDGAAPWLARLEALTRLNLSGTAVTSGGMEPLAALTGLECLLLKDTKVPPAAAKRLQLGLPRLSTLLC